MKGLLREPLCWLMALYALAWLGVYAYTESLGLLSFQSAAEGLGSDASQYVALAKSLATTGVFSIDGITPFFEREPGYSVFLAGVYMLFGVENHVATFVLQGILHALATYAFVRSSKQFLPGIAPVLLAAILLCSPPVFHVLFSLTRESLALSLGMFFTASSFTFLRRPSMWRAILTGGILGVLVLVNVAFLLFPIGFVALLLWWKIPWKNVVLTAVACIAIIAPWGIRNYAHREMLCLTGCYRSALQWYVRGEQSENIGIGTEPAMCLWAEYVSRDWNGRSEYCSFNHVFHLKWQDVPHEPEDALAGREGQAKILSHLPSYLWFSMFEVVELHLPYVNGWGRIYNLSAIAWTAIVYLGCLLAVPRLGRREYLLFAAFALYATGIFALTDATPRYLVPIVHCYAFAAAIGYTGWQQLWRK